MPSVAGVLARAVDGLVLRGLVLGVFLLGDFEEDGFGLFFELEGGVAFFCEILLAVPLMAVLVCGVAPVGPTARSSSSRDRLVLDLVPLETGLAFRGRRLGAELASLRASVVDLGVVPFVDFFFVEMRFFSDVLLDGLFGSSDSPPVLFSFYICDP